LCDFAAVGIDVIGPCVSATVDTTTVPPNPSGVPSVTYLLDDHLGTAQLETSSGGWPVWKGQFTPFGQELDKQFTANNYKFTGKERDNESGLDYFGARYYTSSMGRWTSPDWADKPEAVPYSDLSNPQSLNLYGYVNNNPLSKRDDDGHETMGPYNGVTKYMRGPTPPIGPREAQIDAAVFGALAATAASPEIYAAGMAATTSAEAVGVTAATIGVTGDAVNSATNLVGAATNTNVDPGTNASSSITNPTAIAVLAVTGSPSIAAKAGNVATVITSAIGAAKGNAVANASDILNSASGATAALGSTVNKISSYANALTQRPPAPPAPAAPGCSVAGACPK
jgi:RHS repeat-associated protein